MENGKRHLDSLLESTNTETYLQNDPLLLAHQYEDPRDRELAAFLTACLSYGRDTAIREAASEVLSHLTSRPYVFLMSVSRARIASLLEGFQYRMTKREDMLDLLAGVQQALRKFVSLEELYLDGDRDGHVARASEFVSQIRAGRLRSDLKRGFRYLLPNPKDGSACKRLHMFFRWVVRGPDGVDLGIWNNVSPSVLRMPLDTHTSRIARYIGLLNRKSVDRKAVEQITSKLREFDANDPIKYDFAMAHLGMSKSCIHRRSEEHCPTCPLDPICCLE